MRFQDWPILRAVLVALIIGLLIGFMQGTAIARTGVPPFIVTLSAQLIFRGAVVGITKGSTIAPLSEKFLFIGQAYTSPTVGFSLAVVGAVSYALFKLRNKRKRLEYGLETSSQKDLIISILSFSAFVFLATYILNQYRGIPMPVIILIVSILIFSFIAEATKFGRRVYALGGNLTAAKYSGINVERTITWVYTLNGAMAAIAGLILAARLNAGTVSSGEGFELDAIASCVIGGTSMSGGTGKVSGAIIGALIMATITNGMSMMNLESYMQSIVKGIILFLAVLFDMLSSRKTS